MPLRIGVSGAGDAAPDEMELAELLGAALARRGAIVLTGGLGGVMSASARGACRAGGLTVGVLPGALAAEANPWVVLPVVTALGHARNVVLVQTAEALVAVGGSYGTLNEVALALKVGVPVASIGSWRPARPGHPEAPIEAFDDPEAAAEWAVRAASARRGSPARRSPSTRCP